MKGGDGQDYPTVEVKVNMPGNQLGGFMIDPMNGELTNVRGELDSVCCPGDLASFDISTYKPEMNNIAYLSFDLVGQYGVTDKKGNSNKIYEDF